MKNTSILPAGAGLVSYNLGFLHFTPFAGWIYRLLLAFLFSVFTALFFIPVRIVIKGVGRITAAGQRNWIKAPVSGTVLAVFAAENEAVKKGELLFTIASTQLEEDLAYLHKRQILLRRKQRDLERLTAMCRKEKPGPVRLTCSSYRQELRLFKQELAQAGSRLQQTSADFQRKHYLFESGVLPAVSLEKSRYSREKAGRALKLLYREQGSRWQSSLEELQDELSHLNYQLRKSKKEQAFFSVKAHNSGSLQNMAGLQPGVFFSQGERVAELAPDSGLLARIWLHPKDIGLVKRGMPVRLQVDAFDYRAWGMLSGKVADISKDVLLTPENEALFEVKCSLDSKKLWLKNGYRGNLKRGMTVQARLQLTERTLFQLLSDTAADWLNPYEQNHD